MKRVILSLVFSFLLVSCGDDTEECTSHNCPEGCCLGNKCMDSSPTTCGLGICVDCTADPRSDTCQNNACICEAEGVLCEQGHECTSAGCSRDCIPECAFSCDGASDGCGGICTFNGCSFCCDSNRECIHNSDQFSGLCGAGGDDCIDCDADPRSDSCSQGVCVCAATGSLCAEGEECTQTGCVGCTPDCAGKCQGADDDCGSTCPDNNCTDGCCDGARQCVLYPNQSDSACGKDGENCRDCEIMGEICDVTFTCRQADLNDASFVSQTVPTVMNPSQVVDVSVTFENTGTTTWTDASGHRLGSQNPQDNSTWGTGRVYLDGADAIPPGGTKTFSFQVTAPATPGTYNFQWRMLQEGIEWFGEFGDNVAVTVGSVRVCEAIRALAGTDTDASTAIQTCINDTPSGETLELPAGVYRMDHQVQINARPITVRTEGKNESMPKCALDNHDCAELKASTAFIDTIGILRMLSPGTVVDHIVVNGNKVDRRLAASGQGCSGGNNQYGYNIQLGCNNCTLTNSVTKDALCGTGCEVSGARSNVRVWRNTIAYNGVHNLYMLWADGLTVHDAADSTFAENEAGDNTDVDIIFGGCQNCIIQNNTIWHTDSFEGSSFTALMLHSWDTTSGNYNGTVTSGNAVDCGSQRQCGIGLLIGSHPWYITDTFGGSVHDNTVDNAQFGLLVDDAHDMAVYNNPVTNPAATIKTAPGNNCGWKLSYDYGIGANSANIDTSQDTLGTSYHSVDFDRCIPNWWQ